MRSSTSDCNNENIPVYRYTLNKTKLKRKKKK